MIRYRRLGIVALLLAVWIVLATGIPVTVVARRDPIGGLYPCMDCPCGCVSAAICWDKCCCLSDLQKLAWAEEHAVTPPKFLVDRVKSAAAETPPRQCCCCRSKPDADSHASSPIATDQCDSAQCDSAQCDSAQSDSVESKQVVVMGWAAAKCRGIDMLWQTLTTGVPGDEPAVNLDVPLIARWRNVCHGQPVALSSVDPPVPLPA